MAGFTAFDHGSRKEAKVVIEPEEWLPTDAEITESVTKAKEKEDADALTRSNILLIEKAVNTADRAKKTACALSSPLPFGDRFGVLKSSIALKHKARRSRPEKMTDSDIINLREGNTRLEVLLSRF